MGLGCPRRPLPVVRLCPGRAKPSSPLCCRVVLTGVLPGALTGAPAAAGAEKPGRRKNRRVEYGGLDDGEDGEADVIKRTANGALVKRVAVRSGCAPEP